MKKGFVLCKQKRGWMDIYIEHTNTTHFVYIGAGIRAENGRIYVSRVLEGSKGRLVMEEFNRV